MEQAFLGGGCFWCLDAVYRGMRGVARVTSGYMGGHTVDPDYEAVCSGHSGHAEVVCVEFDSAVTSYEALLGVFFSIHDPTQLNRQGHDVGTQYRSVIFYASPAQQATAAAIIDKLARDDVFGAPVVTVLEPAGVFYPAEDYHQDFYRRNPGQGYCNAVVAPKVQKFRANFAHLLKQDS